MARDRGRVLIDSIAYAIEKAMEVLAGVRHVWFHLTRDRMFQRS